MNARELALDIFLDAEKTGSYAGVLVRETLDKYDYEDRKEKAFLKRLVEGTLERRIALDWAINCCSRLPVEKMKPLIRNLLRISAYQILYMDAVPDSAACNEAVKLAKKRGFSSLSGFVNGVLRRLSETKGALPVPDEKVDPLTGMSVRLGLPKWLISLWTEQYGQQRTRELGEAAGQRRPVTIRFRQGMPGEERQRVLDQMKQAGVSAREHMLYPGAYTLENCDGVANLPGFAEGLIYAQDVSSMLAVEAAGIRPGMRVLDLCGAPGGKAILAYEKLTRREGAWKMPQALSCSGAIKTGDLSEARTARIRENARRMGCTDLEICVWDAAVHMETLEGWADVVLADVPCSGLGVMARKKDIRYRIQPQDLETLCSLQKRILTASWQYVRPGGILLYSTCTMNRMENEEMVNFITGNFPFERESIKEYLPVCLQEEEKETGMLQLFLGEHDTDGFFLARLRRRTENGFAVGASGE